jgi:hypothetical protein
MDGVILLAVIVAGLAFIGALAMTVGVDSRPGFGDARSPSDPVGLS